MTPSERLKLAINNSDLSHQQLANSVGLGKSSIQRYSSGSTKKIPVDIVDKLAPLLGVSTAYIMGWEDKNGDSLKQQEPDPHWEPQITSKDERDVERDLEAMLAGDGIMAAYGNKLPDEMDEEEKENYELYLSAMRTMLLHAKKINKQRHTPLKYRVNDND